MTIVSFIKTSEYGDLLDFKTFANLDEQDDSGYEALMEYARDDFNRELGEPDSDDIDKTEILLEELAENSELTLEQHRYYIRYSIIENILV